MSLKSSDIVYFHLSDLVLLVPRHKAHTHESVHKEVALEADFGRRQSVFPVSQKSTWPEY